MRNILKLIFALRSYCQLDRYTTESSIFKFSLTRIIIIVIQDFFFRLYQTKPVMLMKNEYLWGLEEINKKLSKLPVPGCPATFAYSKARACCACSRCGKVGYILFYIFHLSSLSDVLSFGRRLNMTEILWFRLLTPMVVVSYCQGRPHLVLVNRLEGQSLPRKVPLLTDRLDMTSLLTGP